MDFAYIFSKFCRFYGLSDQQVLKMSLRRFWTMYWQVSRIEAEEDIRHLSNIVAANDKESLKERIEHLQTAIGSPIQVPRAPKIEADADAFQRLRALAG